MGEFQCVYKVFAFMSEIHFEKFGPDTNSRHSLSLVLAIYCVMLMFFIQIFKNQQSINGKRAGIPKIDCQQIHGYFWRKSHQEFGAPLP